MDESYAAFRRALNLHEGDGTVDVLAAIRAVPDPPSPPPRPARDSGDALSPEEELTLPPGATRDAFSGLSSLQSDNFVDEDGAYAGRPTEPRRCGRSASQPPDPPRPRDGASLAATAEDAVEPFTEGVDEESVLGLLPD
jgi:hypothetical protein